jgi:hypothetical protein
MKPKTIKVRVCDKEVEIKNIRSLAIKAYCTDCSGGLKTEVKECPCKDCPLYGFRGYIQWQERASVLENAPEEALGSVLQD